MEEVVNLVLSTEEIKRALFVVVVAACALAPIFKDLLSDPEVIR